MLVNIKVTFITWFTEFVGSCLLLFIPNVFGHGQVGTAIGYTVVVAFYFILIPFLYLVNSSDTKATIVDDSWFLAIKGIFNRTNVQEMKK